MLEPIEAAAEALFDWLTAPESGYRPTDDFIIPNETKAARAVVAAYLKAIVAVEGGTNRKQAAMELLAELEGD